MIILDLLFEKEPKILRWLIVGTSLFHMLLGTVAGLQNKPLRELGVVFTVMGLAAFVAVIWSAFVHPWSMVKALLLIILPGMILAVVVRMVLYGMLLAMAAGPAYALYEILKTIMMIYGLI